MTASSQSDDHSCRSAALQAHAAGLSVWPPEEDGTKQPLRRLNGETWKAGQQAPLSEETLRSLYANDRRGVGVICGAVSRNLEGLDFDDLATYLAFKEAAEAVGLGDVLARIEAGYLERTPKDGRHCLYYCQEIAGNTKLAQRPGIGGEGRPGVMALIETKGEGGFLIVSPSGGSVHPSGRPYELMAGGFNSIATVTPEERRQLLDLARTFDEMPLRDADTETSAAEQSSARPGDEFNRRATWAEVLEPAGWALLYARGATDYWRRPGKDFGASATTNHRESDLLYVFSTSTVFEAGRGYSKFAAYAILFHGGDFGVAAGELRRRGYGETLPSPAAGPEAANGAALSQRDVASAVVLPLTDLGNAERLVAQFGDELRFEKASGHWHTWSGQRWERDELLRMEALAAKTARNIYHEAAEAESRSGRDELGRHAKASESRVKQRALVASAQHMRPSILSVPTPRTRAASGMPSSSPSPGAFASSVSSIPSSPAEKTEPSSVAINACSLRGAWD
ncbi:MAG: bifunctional DNA primase/polymerase [Thermoleophilia bacterium]|nr:bifunctional DNA primase/polymerase [Thermoleophilia bacterium]